MPVDAVIAAGPEGCSAAIAAGVPGDDHQVVAPRHRLAVLGSARSQSSGVVSFSLDLKLIGCFLPSWSKDGELPLPESS